MGNSCFKPYVKEDINGMTSNDSSFLSNMSDVSYITDEEIEDILDKVEESFDKINKK